METTYIPVIPTESKIVFAGPGEACPPPCGDCSPGISNKWAREDHVHPCSNEPTTDFSKIMEELENPLTMSINLENNKEGINEISTGSKGQSIVLTYDLPSSNIRRGIVSFIPTGDADVFINRHPSKKTTFPVGGLSVYVTDNYQDCERLCSLVKYTTEYYAYNWTELGIDNVFRKKYNEIQGKDGINTIDRGADVGKQLTTPLSIYSDGFIQGRRNTSLTIDTGVTNCITLNGYTWAFGVGSVNGVLQLYSKIKTYSGKAVTIEYVLADSSGIFQKISPELSDDTVWTITDSLVIPLRVYINLRYVDGTPINSSDLQEIKIIGNNRLNLETLSSAFLTTRAALFPNSEEVAVYPYTFQAMWIDTNTNELKISIVPRTDSSFKLYYEGRFESHPIQFRASLVKILFFGDKPEI